MNVINEKGVENANDANDKPVCGLFAYYRNVDPSSIKDADPKSVSIAVKAISLCENWVKRRSCNVSIKDPLYKSVSAECFELLLQTLIFASRADGKIDSEEHNSIISVVKKFAQEDEVYGVVDSMLTEDPDVNKIASKIRYKEEALDVYFIAAMILQGDNFMERHFLELFAATLGIAPSLKTKIEQRAVEFLNSKQF